MDAKRFARYVLLVAISVALSGCGYLRMARPSVIEELDPGVVALVNELPKLDHPNDAIVAKIYALGGLTHAKEDENGVMHASVRVPKHQYIWEPAFIVMPRGGELELTFANDDGALHMAYLPSNGGRQLLRLPAHERGRVRIELDEPGWYWWGCPVANHAGRGMFGFILVYGDVPPEARLDRPEMPQPEDR